MNAAKLPDTTVPEADHTADVGVSSPGVKSTSDHPLSTGAITWGA
jgi:hypothetical protein